MVGVSDKIFKHWKNRQNFKRQKENRKFTGVKGASSREITIKKNLL